MLTLFTIHEHSQVHNVFVMPKSCRVFNIHDVWPPLLLIRKVISQRHALLLALQLQCLSYPLTELSSQNEQKQTKK